MKRGHPDDGSEQHRNTRPKDEPIPGLLRLPVELRLEIYELVLDATTFWAKECSRLEYEGTFRQDFFDRSDYKYDEAEFDEKDSLLQEADKEYALLDKTRGSLLGVCQQISTEFAPLYYQRMSVRINRHLPQGRVRGTELNWDTYEPWRYHCGSTLFRDNFLKKMSPANRQCIQYLRYNLLWGESIVIDQARFDVSGALSLGRVLLRYPEILQSLKEVELSAHTGGFVDQQDFDEVDPQDDHKIWWRQATESNEAELNHLIRAYRSRTRFGAFRGWTVHKYIWARPGYVNDLENMFFRIDKVALVFRKPGPDAVADCDDLDAIPTKVTILPSGSWAGRDNSKFEPASCTCCLEH